MKATIKISVELPNGHHVVVVDRREFTKPDDALLELAYEAVDHVKRGVKEITDPELVPDRNTGPNLHS